MILSVSHTFSEEGEREEKEKLKMAAQGITRKRERGKLNMKIFEI